MSEPIREQVSAFLDGELPKSETELLLKRLTRDAELRESFGRYALVGEALRATRHTHLTRGLAARVNQAIDGEAAPQQVRPPAPRWWRTLAGGSVAAGVAVAAVIALQQRAHAPTLAVAALSRGGTAVAALPVSSSSDEAVSYTVPRTPAVVPSALPAARLTSYVFAHSRYSSPLGQRNVLSGLIGDEEAAVNEPLLHEGPGPETHLAP